MLGYLLKLLSQCINKALFHLCPSLVSYKWTPYLWLPSLSSPWLLIPWFLPMAWFQVLKFQWYLNRGVMSILYLIILTHTRVRKSLILLLRLGTKVLVLIIVQDGPLGLPQEFRTLLQFKMVPWLHSKASGRQEAHCQ